MVKNGHGYKAGERKKIYKDMKIIKCLVLRSFYAHYHFIIEILSISSQWKKQLCGSYISKWGLDICLM